MRMHFAGAGRRHGRSHAEAVARADDKPRWLEAFSFTAVGGEVPAARRRVEVELVQLGLTGRARFELMAAVGEALNNAVGHGSPYEEFDDVIVRIGVITGGVMVEITDKGKGLSSARICPPTPSRTAAAASPRCGPWSTTCASSATAPAPRSSCSSSSPREGGGGGRERPPPPPSPPG